MTDLGFWLSNSVLVNWLSDELQDLVAHLRVHSHASCYAASMSPPVAQQVISSMSIIMGEDGSNEGKFFITLWYIAARTQLS